MSNAGPGEKKMHGTYSDSLAFSWSCWNLGERDGESGKVHDRFHLLKLSPPEIMLTLTSVS